MVMPTLESEQLIIRPFEPNDLDAVYQLLDIELAEEEPVDHAKLKEERREWLQWTIASYRQLANLFQPPYGDRAVVLRGSGELIGVCGLVPSLEAFQQLPGFGSASAGACTTPEVGLYYAISPTHRRCGHAAEAARALVDFAFRELRLHRIVATTSYDNVGSIGVMRRLGMHILSNPYPEPPWLQVVGLLDNDCTPEES